MGRIWGRRTVWSSAVLFCVALVVAGCALPGSDQTGSTLRTGSQDFGSDTTSEGGFYDQHYEPGQCLVWNQDAAATQISRVVKCTEPHLMEVLGTIELHADFGAGAPYPTEERWQELLRQHCYPLAARDAGIVPGGSAAEPYVISYIRSQERGWVSGDRKLVCGLGISGTGDRLELHTTPILAA